MATLIETSTDFGRVHTLWIVKRKPYEGRTQGVSVNDGWIYRKDMLSTLAIIADWKKAPQIRTK